MFGGRSELVLGSEDQRFGGGLFYEYGRPDRKLKLFGLPTQRISEVYLSRTHSGGGQSGDPHNNDTHALGALEQARMRFKSVYFDVGWGLQVQSRRTTDLPSYVNSTPTVGAGFVFNTQKMDWLVGLRWLHISNGGTQRRNPGQNQLFLMIGVRY
jgi:hypothetical protein